MKRGSFSAEFRAKQEIPAIVDNGIHGKHMGPVIPLQSHCSKDGLEQLHGYAND